MQVAEMKVNGKEVEEAKLNGQIVYRKETTELENIIYNADFRLGTSGFSKFVNGTIQNVTDGWLTWVKQIISANTYILCTFTKELIPGHTYYGRCEFNVTEEGKTFRGQLQLNAPNITSTSSYVDAIEDNVVIISGMFNVTEQYRLFLNINSATENLETIFRLRNTMFVDVTDLINSGLTEEQVKAKLDAMPFFADKT